MNIEADAEKSGLEVTCFLLNPRYAPGELEAWKPQTIAFGRRLAWRQYKGYSTCDVYMTL